MYVNYVNDRKKLGYKVMKDTNDGIKLVLITKSTVLLIRNLSLNLKGKSKRIVVVISLATVVQFSNFESVSAVGLPLPPAPLVRVQPSYQYNFNVQIAKGIPRKKDLIAYKSPKEILLLIYATDPRLGSNPQVLKVIKDLRGGNWAIGLVGTAAFIGFIMYIFSLTEGFVPNNPDPGWGLDRPDPFQPPMGEHRYPPAYDLLFPRRTSYADRPGGSQIMAGVNQQSSREELTQLSTNVVSTQTQISEFVKNGKVDLNQAFNEVNRRAAAIGCETFDCSFERFKELATECGQVNANGTREAITILQGEMHGYYKNSRRVDYGPDVKGIDFAVEGLGEFENITHAEAKNAVGSAIEIEDGFDPNIWKQGKKIGKKSVWQKKFWSNTSRTSQIPNLNVSAYLPQSVNSTLTVVDCYDVPDFEKPTMDSAINFGAKNDTNLIILNNRTNI